jgi:hypothetical protein
MFFHKNSDFVLSRNSDKITPSNKKKLLKMTLHLVVSFLLLYFAIAYLGYFKSL